MENITHRTNYLSDVEVDDVIQKDMSSMNFGDFDWGPIAYYQCSQFDIGRPDLISYKIYGTTNYWWFLMWFNGVADVWNDLREKMVIAYPDLTIVREALKTARRKEAKKK